MSAQFKNIKSSNPSPPHANGSPFFKPAVQAKLSVNQPNDIYEQEADAAADRVMRTTQGDWVQTKFFNPVSTVVQTKCAHCEEEEKEKKMQRKEINDNTADLSSGMETYVSNLDTSGQQLPGKVRNFFEPRIGYDFRSVKVHTDTAAAKSAQSINALAYTSGNNIVFNNGQYSPDTDSGKRLLGHELTHVVQQGSAITRKKIQRQTGSSPTPTYGSTCTGGSTDPCQHSRCDGRHQGIFDDLLRASNYAITAAGALIQSPLSQNTIRALDWYFNDHSPATAEMVAQRLRCIALCLIDTFGNDQYGCHPDDPNIAYVCVGTTPVCEDATTNICLTDTYFGKSDRVRAEALVHECGHRIGLSLGGPDFDVYDHLEHFYRLSTAEALMNTDSFALFAAAIVNGVRTSVYGSVFPTALGVGAGVALSGGDPTWYARLNYFNIEFEQPVLGVFNPNLGISATLIGESTSAARPGVTASTSFLASVTAGFRIGDPRPGPAGGAYFSFWGGPALALSIGSSNSSVGIGAEAGIAGGYRWRWLDASVGGTYFRDPTRPEGFKDIFTIGPSLTINFLPIRGNVPGSK